MVRLRRLARSLSALESFWVFFWLNKRIRSIVLSIEICLVGSFLFGEEEAQFVFYLLVNMVAKDHKRSKNKGNTVYEKAR